MKKCLLRLSRWRDGSGKSGQKQPAADQRARALERHIIWREDQTPMLAMVQASNREVPFGRKLNPTGFVELNLQCNVA